MKQFSPVAIKKLIAQEKFNVKKDSKGLKKSLWALKNKINSPFLFIFLTFEMHFYIFYKKLNIFYIRMDMVSHLPNKIKKQNFKIYLRTGF